jgi:hypothetical protein
LVRPFVLVLLNINFLFLEANVQVKKSNTAAVIYTNINANKKSADHILIVNIDVQTTLNQADTSKIFHDIIII